MDTIVLAGGLGTRMREETEYRPKPMVSVGQRPVLWHIMKNLSFFGLNDFLVATGYRADVIQDFFLNFEARTSDVRITLGRDPRIDVVSQEPIEDWRVSLFDTGTSASTGDRVAQIAQRHDLSDTFMIVYGDGLADVDVTALVESHRAAGTLATVTVVRHQSRFGIVELDSSGRVEHFREKPTLDNFVSIGFILMQNEALEFFATGDSLEEGPLTRIANAGQLNAFVHHGFWEPMDTYREFLHLNELWDSGEAPWKVW